MNSIDTQFATRRNVALQPGTLQAALLDRLTRTLGKNPESATARDIYDALSLAVREELTLRWLTTQRRVANAHVKRVCYFSVEYLPGRTLLNALSSLEDGLLQEARIALRDMGHDLDDIAAQEVEDVLRHIPAVADVAVIGYDLGKAFFPAGNALDKIISVEGFPYRVIGVFEHRKGQLFQNPPAEKQVLVPYQTYRKHHPADDEHFIGAVAAPGKMAEAKDEISAVLRNMRLRR